MTETLTAEGYEQTKEKLRDLETRLCEIEKRTDLDADHLASVRRSYKMMMRELLQEIKLYEAKRAKQDADNPARTTPLPISITSRAVPTDMPEDHKSPSPPPAR